MLDYKKCIECEESKPLSEMVTCSSCDSGYANKCKSCHNVWNAAYRKRTGRTKADNLRNNYGITMKQYEDMLKKQKGLCALCGEVLSITNPHHVALDHCHTTNKIRGVLCTWCNHGLGNFKDNPEYLHKAIVYLVRSLYDPNLLKKQSYVDKKATKVTKKSP